ncbi:MAG: tripartite tricarboxylate transporter TctB family protein [Lachnospiraceae bacterium]|nr:tripartite tricarboxylate transporter TctB family protein [Lachnospiraceae bacterium]
MDQEKKAFRQSIGVSLVIMAFAVAALVFSLPMPGNAPIFPRMAAGFLFFCALGLLVGTIMRKNKGEAPEVAAVDFGGMQSPLATLLLVIVYALGFKYIGFYVTTLVITVVLMIYMGIRSVKTIGLVAGILLIFLYGLFTMQLKVPMPKGLLF